MYSAPSHLILLYASKKGIILQNLTSLVWCSLIGWNLCGILSCCSSFSISCWNTSLSCSLSIACSWNLVVIMLLRSFYKIQNHTYAILFWVNVIVLIISVDFRRDGPIFYFESFHFWEPTLLDATFWNIRKKQVDPILFFDTDIRVISFVLFTLLYWANKRPKLYFLMYLLM